MENLDSKYLNRAQDADGFNPCGDNTGFVISPSGTFARHQIEVRHGPMTAGSRSPEYYRRRIE